jgi:ATP-binding protein involved in chromosome partitioning
MSYYLEPQTQSPIYLFGKEGGKRLAREQGYPFLGQIPLDPVVGICGDKGESLFSVDPSLEKEVTKAFMQLAQQVIEHVQALQNQMNATLAHVDLIWKEMKP